MCLSVDQPKLDICKYADDTLVWRSCLTSHIMMEIFAFPIYKKRGKIKLWMIPKQLPTASVVVPVTLIPILKCEIHNTLLIALFELWCRIFFSLAPSVFILAARSVYLKQSWSPCSNKQPHTVRKEKKTTTTTTRNICVHWGVRRGPSEKENSGKRARMRGEP